MTMLEEMTALRARIIAAESERDTWRGAGNQEKYLEACSFVAALELRLDRMRSESVRRAAAGRP
jgi:hypothetical protein